MRVALQRHAALVLLGAGANPVDVAPLLLASAGPGDTAAVAALRAAAEELAATQPAAAADISARALDLARDDDPHRGALVAETVLRLHTAGRPREATALAAREFQRTLPPEQEAEVLLNLSVMFSRSPGERTEDNRRALALDGVPPGLRAQHLARLTHNLATSGRYREARRVAGLAKDAIRASGDMSAEPALRTALAVLEYADERYERVIEIIDAIPRVTRGPEDPRSDVADAWRCEARAVLDDLDVALAETNVRLAAAEREGRAWAVHIWLACRGRLLFQAGRLDDGRATLDAALAMADVGGANVANAAGLLTLGRIGLHTGDDGQVRTALRLGAERLDQRLPSMRQSLDWLRALDAAAHGDPWQALQYVMTADDDDEPGNGLPSLPRDTTDDTHLVRIALAAGDRARALDTVERAERRAADHPAIATMAGVAAHARGLLDRDPEALADAVERYRSGVRPLALASALEDAGSYAATHGHRTTAVQWLGEALETYARLGATRDAARSRQRLRDLGVRRRIGSRQRPQAGWRGLTASELRVARLAARGLTNRQIGEQLFISPHTVSSHLRHTFTKLEISSRIELARMASRHEPANA